MSRSNLEVLRGIERLGGSAGYQEHLELLHMTSGFTHNTTSTSDDSFPVGVGVTGSLISLAIYTKIQVTLSVWTGTGQVWGAGLGGAKFWGTLYFNSYTELTSAENSIQMSNLGIAADVVLMQFFIGEKQVASLTAYGVGAGAFVGSTGSLTWDPTHVQME